MASERSESALRPILWAQPIASTFSLSNYRRRWACTVWLDRHQVLLGGMDKDDRVRWERLDIRTGNRRTETAFGPRLAKLDEVESEYHNFDPVGASPDGTWLLGYFDVNRRGGTPGVLGPGGKKQTWDIPTGEHGFLETISIHGWLPGGRRFLGWKSWSAELCVFEIGRAYPSVIRLRGLPSDSWLLGSTPRGTALLCHLEHGYDTVYEAALEPGARVHRRGRFVVPEEVSSDWLLSPSGDRMVIWGFRETADGSRHAASLWGVDLSRWKVRCLGRTPWRADSPDETSDLGLTGISWHPDGRRVSFLHNDDRRRDSFLDQDDAGCRLYLARV